MGVGCVSGGAPGCGALPVGLTCDLEEEGSRAQASGVSTRGVCPALRVGRVVVGTVPPADHGELLAGGWGGGQALRAVGRS